MSVFDDPDFCWSCGRLEPIPAGRTPRVVCVECGHVYMTARGLRRAYRRQLWRTTWWMGFSYAGLADVMWRIRRTFTVRTEEIFFCQECIHDF